MEGRESKSRCSTVEEESTEEFAGVLLGPAPPPVVA